MNMSRETSVALADLMDSFHRLSGRTKRAHARSRKPGGRRPEASDYASGTTSANRDPAGVLSTVRSPPSRSTIRFASANPSPAPGP